MPTHVSTRPHSLSVFATTLATLAVAAGGLLAPLAQAASEYPKRAITLVVPGPAGGTPDVTARQLAEQLHQHLGQPVLIDNRAGAAGGIGAAAAAQAKPDGYTLLMGFAQTMAINPVTFRTLNYDPVNDFTPVARLVEFELGLVVPESVPATTVPELVQWLEDNQDKAAFGSFGPGTPSQFAGQMFTRKAGVDAVHVPYKGSAPLVNELLGGRVHFGFVVPQVAMPHVKAGKLRMLAVTGPERSAQLPDVPTMQELGYDEVVAGGWYGVFAPQGTPEPIVTQVSEAVKASVESPAFAKLLEQQDLRAAWLDGPSLGEFQQYEIDRWRDIAERTNFQAQD